MPQGFSAAGFNGQISLNWTTVPGAQSYNPLQRATTPESDLYSLLAGGFAPTNYLDTNALAGTVYFYTVTASNACGATATSVEVSAPLMITSSLQISDELGCCSGWGGVAGRSYYTPHFHQSTYPGHHNWARLATNTFGASGGFNFTNAFDPVELQRYFRIQQLP